MKSTSHVWINMFSAFIFLALVGFYLSEISGNFFSALATGTSAEHDQSFHFIGRMFGFFFSILLGAGTVLVPGELLGFVRFYKRTAENFYEQRSLARALLLSMIAILSIASVVSLAMAVARLTK